MRGTVTSFAMLALGAAVLMSGGSAWAQCSDADARKPTCSEADCRRLYSDTKEPCNNQKSCKDPGLEKAEYQDRREKFRRCLKARQAVAECFKSPDSGHKRAIADQENAIKICDEAIDNYRAAAPPNPVTFTCVITGGASDGFDVLATNVGSTPRVCTATCTVTQNDGTPMSKTYSNRTVNAGNQRFWFGGEAGLKNAPLKNPKISDTSCK